MAIANLVIFVFWVSVVMYLAANPRIPAFNREFSGLIIATACLFYGLISSELWAMALMVYLGIRTFQKSKENGHAITTQ